MNRVIDLDTGQMNLKAANDNPENNLLHRNALHAALKYEETENRDRRAVDQYSMPRGTLVDAYHCEMPVEELRAGDTVQTVDSGFQPILWAGSYVVTSNEHSAPIRFAPGSIGNVEAITVSPGHRFMLAHPAAEQMYGVREVLVEARHLVNDENIHYVHTNTMEYFQMLFSHHQIIFANGVSSASLHINSRTLVQEETERRREWIGVLPKLQDAYINQYGPSARLILTEKQVRTLAYLGRFRSRPGN